MQSLNLNKGDLLNLTKDYSTLKNINMGLGWDASTGGRGWDLDSIGVMLDSDNKVVSIVSYRNKDTRGMRLNGDNMTGVGDGDDEVISVSLGEIPDSVVSIGFFANIFGANGRDFSGVRNAYIRMVNSDNNTEIAKYELSENGKGFNAFHFANLVRNNGEWEFKAVGKGTNGDVMEVVAYFARSYEKESVEQDAIKKEAVDKNEAPKAGILGRLFGRK